MVGVAGDLHSCTPARARVPSMFESARHTAFAGELLVWFSMFSCIACCDAMNFNRSSMEMPADISDKVFVGNEAS